MGIDVSEWLDMMADTVTVYPFASRSVAGVPTYSTTGTTYPAYIRMKNKLIVDKGGREILARGYVILGSNAVVGTEDKIVLPSDYVPVNPPILGVDISPDENGNHHTTVWIG